ncbi:hypothetical protein [Amycolatopsis sp. 195334CR]|uniref:hypothetical protein n=1 Tax=Amycolatopsis sp. 195334CR TaxID=2814588 RepID=UPI001A8CF356|nr:hypothetical protein [Amycolatopsis sp. 195334CR]MBN6035239.1 hypothetical protein [Amycolatopsis sp. 195334CR]
MANVWAWGAVGILVAVSFGVGLFVEKRRRAVGAASADTAPVEQAMAHDGGVVSHNGGAGASVSIGGQARDVTIGPTPKVVLALVLGLAVVLTAALVIVASTGTGGAGAGALPSVPTAVTTGTLTPGPGVSSPSASPSPAGTRSTSCQKEGSEAAVGDLPFTCTVEMMDVTCGLGNKWVVGKDATEIREPMPSEASSVGWRAWAAVADGVQGSGGRQNLIIQGKGDARVVLTKVVVRVLARRPPVVGNTLERECGGDGVFRSMTVDLDKTPPAVLPKFDTGNVMDGAPEYETKPIKFPYTVALEDPESFVIEGETERCDCDWVVELSWSSQGRTGTTTIDNNGAPFRTTSTANAPTCYVREMIEC